MPTALMLSICPVAPATVAQHLGRAAHAALLQAVAATDAPLAERLHGQTGVKSFAVSDLLGVAAGRNGRRVVPDQSYGLRWVGVSAELDVVLRGWAAAPPATLTLDGTVFTVTGATLDRAVQPWAGQAEWNDLLALEQVGRVPPHHLAVEFWSPTTFRSNGRNIVLPLPELVFGSLLERWNAASPVAMPTELRRWAGEALLLGRYDLQARWLPMFGAGETAFTGKVSYTVTQHERYYVHCCQALLRWGFFCGVGAKTSMGLGMVSLIPDEAPPPGD